MIPLIPIGFIALGVLTLAFWPDKGKDDDKHPSENGPSGDGDDTPSEPGSAAKPPARSSSIGKKPKKGKTDVRMVDDNLATGDSSSGGNGSDSELYTAARDRQAETIEGEGDDLHTTEHSDDGGNDNGDDVRDEPTGGA